MIDLIERDAMRARALASTPGELTFEEPVAPAGACDLVGIGADGEPDSIAEWLRQDGVINDASFFATARTDTLRLLDALDEMERERDECAGANKIIADERDRQDRDARAADVIIDDLRTEVRRLTTLRAEECSCAHGDARRPLAGHDRDCPVRVNRLKRIPPEVALARIAKAIDTNHEVDELQAEVARLTRELADAHKLVKALRL